MHKNVLILGAGLVSQPLIDYLFKHTEHILTVADVRLEQADKAIHKHPRGLAKSLDVQDSRSVHQLVDTADLVVSLLPYTLHTTVARHCVELGKHMVNASYISQDMQALDPMVKQKGLLFLCEMGLDPGLDHMSAMKIIHDVKEQGGEVYSFVSVCGGLPAPDANTNPFGYKFSWSPKGVLLAGNNSARYIEAGTEHEIPARQLFHSTTPMQIDAFQLEAYPNRDSVSYKKVYGLDNIDLLMRGTLRYEGWHHYILALERLHMLEETPVAAGVTSFRELVAAQNNLDPDHIRTGVQALLEMDKSDPVLQALDWLGLMNSARQNFKGLTVLDALAGLMSERMAYQPGERDMVVLQHEFKARYPDHEELITSSLIDYGIPNGPSAMARTVSLPLAIAVKMILENKINLKGVQIPVHRQIYEPVLRELETAGIHFKEEIKRIESIEL